MIAPALLPQAYEDWNRRWHAPHGGTVPAPLRRLPDWFEWKARARGPFAFQPNNHTRRFEYPWAFHSVPVGRGQRAVDVGGGLSGFQFTVAKAGSTVTNVDPFADYGSTVGYDAVDPEQAIARLNRIFRTSVRLERRDLVAAALPAQSVDVVYCISTLEHLEADARAATVHEVARILRPGGRLVLTVDLFLDLAPFTTRTSNRYGTNVDLAEMVDQSPLTLADGNRSELFGYAEFDADRIQANLSEYLIGGYPAMAQCLILRPS